VGRGEHRKGLPMPDDPSHPMDHIVVVLLEHRSLGILLGHQRSRASSKRAEIVRASTAEIGSEDSRSFREQIRAVAGVSRPE